MAPADEAPATMQQGGVLLSDAMGRDRSINIFAGLARDVEAVARRLDDAAQRSTVLAPLNSRVDAQSHKPWEDPADYRALGAGAYEGPDGQERARRNQRRFAEAHVVPVSPWKEGEKARSLLPEDREIWWETRDGKKVVRPPVLPTVRPSGPRTTANHGSQIQPDNIEVENVAGRVGNGEVWILRGVRNYA